MSRGRPITPKDPQKIIERYLAGETAKEIGCDFGYTDRRSGAEVFTRRRRADSQPGRKSKVERIWK
jgi:hypothetical protein